MRQGKIERRGFGRSRNGTRQSLFRRTGQKPQKGEAKKGYPRTGRDSNLLSILRTRRGSPVQMERVARRGRSLLMRKKKSKEVRRRGCDRGGKRDRLKK